MKKTNDAFSVLIRMCRSGIIAGLMGMLLVATAAKAQLLSVPNSSISVSTTSGQLSNWNLNGTREMQLQAFYYSVGSGDVYSISSISSGTTTAQSSSSLTENYANSTLSLTTGYSLGQTASGANLSSSISLQNLSGASQTFHFYQYSDFTLGGTASGQNVQFLETTIPYEVEQTGNGQVMTGTLSALAGGGLATVEEVAGVYDGTDFGLGNGVPAPTFSDTPLSASGNVDFGYEITATLAANSSLTLSELQAVPEPSSVALVTAGVLCLGLLRGGRLGFFKK
jgi:hypothetical protein